MRIKRHIQKQREHKKHKGIIIIFCIIIPLMAILTSIAVIGICTGNFNFVSKDKSNNLKPAFEYLIDINSTKIYRLEIAKYDTYEAATNAVTNIKEKKLNAFILKENGYVVIYGIFTHRSQVQKVQKRLNDCNIENNIAEIIIPNYNLLYNEENAIVKNAKKIDELVLDLINKKSELSVAMLENFEELELLNVVLELEQQLENCELAFNNLVENNETLDMKEKYAILLKGILKYRLKLNQTNNYYTIQNSLLNQIELLQNFKEN